MIRVASGSRRAASAATASGASSGSPLFATITGSTHDGRIHSRQPVGHHLDGRPRPQHPHLDRVHAEVREHRRELRADDRAAAPGAGGTATVFCAVTAVTTLMP